MVGDSFIRSDQCILLTLVWCETKPFQMKIRWFASQGKHVQCIMYVCTGVRVYVWGMELYVIKLPVVYWEIIVLGQYFNFFFLMIVLVIILKPYNSESAEGADLKLSQ